MELRNPAPLDDFLFDLRGYLILENAVEPELLTELNRAFDDFPPLKRGEWWGNAQRRDYTDDTGFELHNCVEAGRPFEALIDHPGWINFLRRYCGEQDSYVQGLFIDECIASILREGIIRYIRVGIGGRCAARMAIRTECFAAGSAISFWR